MAGRGGRVGEGNAVPQGRGRRLAARLARFRRPSLALALAGCLLGAVGASAPLPFLTRHCAAGDGPSHVALVVEHGDGRLLVECVAFSGPAISGSDVLRLSGIEAATTGYAGLGQAVCQLDGEPATYPPGCFTDSGPYWALFVARAGGAWTVSSLGISSQTFRDGDAEGFRYDPQTGAPAPPAAAGRCPPAPLPTVRPSPTRSPSAVTAPAATSPRASRATPSATSLAAAQTPGPTVTPPTTSALPLVVASQTTTPGGSTAGLAGPVPSGVAPPRPGEAQASSMTTAWPSWAALGLATLLLTTLGLGARRRRRVP